MKKRISILIIVVLVTIPFAKTANHSKSAIIPNVIDNYGYYYENYFSNNSQSVLGLNDGFSKSKNSVLALASQPYRMYFQKTTEKISKAIELETYSKWGIFAIVFLMWFFQAIVLLKED